MDKLVIEDYYPEKTKLVEKIIRHAILIIEIKMQLDELQQKIKECAVEHKQLPFPTIIERRNPIYKELKDVIKELYRCSSLETSPCKTLQ